MKESVKFVWRLREREFLCFYMFCRMSFVFEELALRKKIDKLQPTLKCTGDTHVVSAGRKTIVEKQMSLI